MRGLAALTLLAWLGTAGAAPSPTAALEADLRAWLAQPPGPARAAFATRRLLPWFDTGAMLTRALGPRAGRLPPPRRRELAGAFRAFLLAGLERRLATGGPWTRRLAASAGGEGLLLLAGRHGTAGFALRRGPAGWQVVDVLLDGTSVVTAWCRRHGC